MTEKCRIPAITDLLDFFPPVDIVSNMLKTLILALLLIGCTPGSGKNTLNIHLGAEPPTLDPSRAESVVDIRILQNISEPLLEYNEKLELQGAMAASWSISADGLTLSFELNRNRVWSDGKPLTSKNYLYSILRTLDPKVDSKLAYLLYPIKNAKAYKMGNIKEASAVGITAPSPYTLVVRLEEKSVDFIHAFASVVTFPQRRDIVEKFGDRYGSEAHLPSSGPFTLDDWKHEKEIILSSNKSYGGFPKPKIKRIVARIVQEGTTALSLFETDKIDILEQVPLEGIRRLKNDPRMRVYPDFSTYFIGFNVRKKPFNDARVRKAFIMGIERPNLENILVGSQPVAFSFIPPGLAGYNADAGIKFDPAKAKELLASAGFPGGKNFPEVEIGFNSHERHQQIAEWLEQEWRRNLNVSVSLRSEEWKVYLTTLSLSPPQLYRFAWAAVFPDPLSMLLLWTKDNPNNYSGWHSPKYDFLVSEISQTSNQAVRLERINEAQKLISDDDPPFIPLYFYARHILVNPRVMGFRANGLGVLSYKYVSLENKVSK